MATYPSICSISYNNSRENKKRGGKESNEKEDDYVHLATYDT